MSKEDFKYYLNINYAELLESFYLTGCNKCFSAYDLGFNDKCPKCGGYALKDEKKNRKIIKKTISYWSILDIFIDFKREVYKINIKLNKNQLKKICLLVGRAEETPILFERLSLYLQARREFFRQGYYYVKGQIGFNSIIYQINIKGKEKNDAYTKLDQIKTTKYLEFIYKNFGIYTKLCKKIEITAFKLGFKGLAKEIRLLSSLSFEKLFKNEIEARKDETRKNTLFVKRLIKEKGLKDTRGLKSYIKDLKQFIKDFEKYFEKRECDIWEKELKTLHNGS